MQIIQRGLEEKRALDVKLEGLDSFIGSNGFESLSKADKNLLVSQFHFMDQYSKVLADRIARFYIKQQEVAPNV